MRFYSCTGSGWPAPFSQFGNVISSARGGSDSLLIFPYAAGGRPNAMGVRTKYSSYTVDQIIYTSANPVVANTLNSASSGKLVTVEPSGELRSKGFTVDANGFIKVPLQLFSFSPIVLSLMKKQVSKILHLKKSMTEFT